MGGKYAASAEELLVDRAQFLTLSAPEMTLSVTEAQRWLNSNCFKVLVLFK